jgi:nitroreductase
MAWFKIVAAALFVTITVLPGCGTRASNVGQTSAGATASPATGETIAIPGTTIYALPKPSTRGGMPLMEALSKRQTMRSFTARQLSDQVLSNLLWAACGKNRPDGKRTAPTAVNWQEIDVYVARADGLWLFQPKTHSLKLVAKEDLRALTGKQDFVKDAPVNLVFVADFAKMASDRMNPSEADKVFYSATDTGFVSQNVYLFCASEGLATVVRGMVDKPALAKAMSLRPDQRIILTQSVGYPK